MRDAKNAGVDGLLTVDLPPEEAREIKERAEKQGLDLIFLLAPTSNDERIKLIVNNASGFIYYVSLTGVTGARSQLDRDIRKQVKRIKKHTSLPIGVGFGISKPAHARQVSKWADAVVVGSALINIISRSGSKKEMMRNSGNFIRGLKRVLR